MYVKSKITAFVLLGMLCGLMSCSAIDFVVAKKIASFRQPSLNTLKEQLGDGLREAIYTVNTLLQDISTLQTTKSRLLIPGSGMKQQKIIIEPDDGVLLYYAGATTGLLASVHDICSRSIERLINNHVQFKKAKREHIHQTLEIVKQVKDLLAAVHDHMHNEASSRDMRSHCDEIKKSLELLKNADCLKHG